TQHRLLIARRISLNGLHSSILFVGRKDSVRMRGVELCEAALATNPSAHWLRFLALDDERDCMCVDYGPQFPLHRGAKLHVCDYVSCFAFRAATVFHWQRLQGFWKTVGETKIGPRGDGTSCVRSGHDDIRRNGTCHESSQAEIVRQAQSWAVISRDQEERCGQRLLVPWRRGRAHQHTARNRVCWC